jgi:DNA-binding NarL/FixJ family response regulator
VTDQRLCVLIADDHPIYRKGLSAQFEASAAIEVVEAADAQSAVMLASELHPAVTLMDLRMPAHQGEDTSYSGIEAIRTMLRGDPEAIVVVLTMYDDDGWIIAALRAGARGYLLKEVDDTDIVASVRAAAGGVAVLSRGIARRLPDLFLSTTTRSKAFPELTSQQIEVLALAAMGKCNDDIASSLHLASKTVSNYIADIRGRLGAANRAELIALARDRGITAGPG